MTRADSARTFYESARDELIQRIHLRDNILLAFLGAIGVLFGVALGTQTRMEVVLAVPFLAMGATYLVSQHFAVIGALSKYCVEDIEPFLEKEDGREWAPQWDNSPSLREYNERAITMRTLGHTCILLIPCVAALGANYQHAVGSTFPLGIVWWFGLAGALCSAWVLRATHILRANLLRSKQWRQQ